jgi:uncharacterized OB-fold protein
VLSICWGALMLEVTVMRCTECRALDPGPRDFCPECANALEPVAVPGTGVVETWTTIRRPPQRYRSEGPYQVAVVRLDDGVRVVGRLQGPAPTSAGARVSLAEQHDGVLQFAIQEGHKS